MNWRTLFTKSPVDPSRFRFQGKMLPYVDKDDSLKSERAVEISVADAFIMSRPTGVCLEVGNTLRHYQMVLTNPPYNFRERTIVDKFEKDLGVHNIDLFDYTPRKPFQTILSISTVEHIGQGVDPQSAYGETAAQRDQESPLRAIRKLYDLLASQGKALVTVPYGKLLDGGWYIQFNFEYLNLLWSHYGVPEEAIQYTALQREFTMDTTGNAFPRWVESDLSQLGDTEYNYPHDFANAILVIELTKIAEAGSFPAKASPIALTYASPVK